MCCTGRPAACAPQAINDGRKIARVLMTGLKPEIFLVAGSQQGILITTDSTTLRSESPAKTWEPSKAPVQCKLSMVPQVVLARREINSGHRTAPESTIKRKRKMHSGYRSPPETSIAT